MPLLWFRVASDGSGSERYTLQVPFQLGSTHALTSEDAKAVKVGDHNLEIVENQGIQLLRITDFNTPAEAEEFFPRLRGSILRLIVKKKLGMKSTRSMQKVQLQESPIDVRNNPTFGSIVKPKGWTHIDGYIDPTPAVVIPEHFRIMEIGGGSASLMIGMRVVSFLEQLAEGLRLPEPERIAKDEHLSLSIELYAASFWEMSQRTRIINLATVLEALIAPKKVIQEVSDRIDKLLETFDSARDCSAENAEQHRALDRIRSRLANLKEESISENLRELVAAHTAIIGETIEEARRNVTNAYGVRSKLVHDGYASEEEIKDAADWLGKVVPAILESLVNEASETR